MIPASSLSADPVVARWQAFFAPIDWTVLDQERWRRPGPTPHPPSAYGKALLIKVQERLGSMPRLRQFLVEHPLLVLELGFRPVADPTQPYGFDWSGRCRATAGCATSSSTSTPRAARCWPGRWGRCALIPSWARRWPSTSSTSTPGCARTTPRRTSPTASTRDAADRAAIPDCRLGVKARANQTQAGGTGAKEYCGATARGIASRHQAGLRRRGRRRGHPALQPPGRHLVPSASTRRPAPPSATRPTNLAADAAFDAWHVYQPSSRRGARRHRPQPARAGAPARRGRPPAAATRACDGSSDASLPARGRLPGAALPLPAAAAGPTGDHLSRSRFAARPGLSQADQPLKRAGRCAPPSTARTAPTGAVYRQRTSSRAHQQPGQGARASNARNVRTQAAVERLAALIGITINLRLIARTQRSQP